MTKDKTEIVVCDDELNNSISKHLSNGTRPLRNVELLQELKACRDLPRSLVYCQRDCTPDKYDVLQQPVLLKLNIVEDLISSKKQENLHLLRQ